MKIENIKIEKLIPNRYNPRKITKDSFEKLKNSINEFGFVDPIIVRKNKNKYEIIGGHQRYNAAKELGYELVPCIVLDISEKRAKLLNLALNKIRGDWDSELLVKLLNQIKDESDLVLAGFDFSEVENLITKVDYNVNKEYELSEQLKKFHDYIVFIFDNREEFEAICEYFQLEKKRSAYRDSGIGLGRIIFGEKLISLIER